MGKRRLTPQQALRFDLAVIAAAERSTSTDIQIDGINATSWEGQMLALMSRLCVER